MGTTSRRCESSVRWCRSISTAHPGGSGSRGPCRKAATPARQRTPSPKRLASPGRKRPAGGRSVGQQGVDLSDELGVVERLGDKGVGALLQAALTTLDVAGHHDDRNRAGAAAPDVAQYGPAVDVG